MFYLIYKITNKINGKFYIGAHKTSDKDDDYMGSGKALNAAFRKYGIENFKKDILECFETAEEMFAKEKKLVNDEFLLRKDVYNLRMGGFGGFDYINSKKLNNNNKDLKTLQKAGLWHKERLLTDEVYREQHRQRNSKKFKKLHNEGKFKYDNFTGKIHKESSKKLIGAKNSMHQAGEGNSQYGTMWITNGIDNIKIKKESTIPDGWRKGRFLKK